MPKISAHCVVVNEEDYVYYALKSIYDVVEEIIIVEGADRQRHSDKAVEAGVLTHDGLSGDRTGYELERLFDEDYAHKIKYTGHGWVGDMDELRMIAYKQVSPDTDYILVVDADSLFHPDEIRKVRDICEEYPWIWAVTAVELMFFKDMGHILTVAPEKLAYCNFEEAGLFWKYDPRFIMVGQRPHRPGKRVKLEASIDRATDPKGWNIPINYAPRDTILHAYHYGWVHDPERMEQHILRWAHASIDLVKRGGGDPKLIGWSKPILNSDDEEILDYYQLYHKIWTGIYDQSVGEHLEPFDGGHPPVIVHHPYFGKSAEDLGWDSGI